MTKQQQKNVFQKYQQDRNLEAGADNVALKENNVVACSYNCSACFLTAPYPTSLYVAPPTGNFPCHIRHQLRKHST